MSRFSAVLFDMDGTLLDTLTDLSFAVNDALKTLDCPTHSKETICTFIGHGLRHLMRCALPEGKRDTHIDQAMDNFSAYYDKHHSDYTLPYTGILDMLQTLCDNKLPIGIVSNKDDAFVRTLTAQFFGHYTNICVGRQPGVAEKPDPTMAQMGAKMLGVPCEEILFVGDSLVDWQTAQNAHMHGACVCWGFHGRQALASQGVTTLFDTTEALTDFILHADLLP